MAQKRKPGISLLIATQNEEAIVSLCLRSFLEFGDELIVVDNGSTDHTKEIVRDLQAKHPRKIKFFDKPELPDLCHNRQFAFEQSSYEWIMRGDSDYVAYTDGEYDIMRFREYLLTRKKRPWPEAVAVRNVNVIGDFRHTGAPTIREHFFEVVTVPMLRFYRWFPFFRFQRRGRWEGVRFQRLIRTVVWDQPLWMHCDIKSDMNHFFRSQRTNWRQLGDFERFPSLLSYCQSVIGEKYGTDNIAEAAHVHLERDFLVPYLRPYDPEKFYPYPALVREQMEKNPIYELYREEGRFRRRFLGLDLPGTCDGEKRASPQSPTR